MPLTSRNEFRHTLPGGVSGASGLIAAHVLVGRAYRSAHDAPAPAQDEGAGTGTGGPAQGRDQRPLETLRELARGIYPPLLADQGLTAAVTTQAIKASGPVEVDADGLGRYPAEIETAIYFSCVEAPRTPPGMRRGQRYGSAWPGTAGRGMFTVTDEGPGFDSVATAVGSGLQNMSDRLAALGGSCQVDSRPGRGTTVAGRIGSPDATAGNSGTEPLAGHIG